MTTVSCVGITVRDIVFEVSRLPDGPGKVHAVRRREVGGGVAANAAATVASLGGTARLFSPVGDDQLGDALREELADLGVDVAGVSPVPGVGSPLSAVAVDGSGERAIVNHTDRRLFAKAPVPDVAALEGSHAVLADTRWPQAATAALGWARSRAVPGVLDFDVGRADTDEGLVAEATHVIFAADALRRLTGCADLEEGLREVGRNTDAIVGVTAGEDGAYWLDGGEVAHSPAFAVEVVDTTGAGDVFHGAFALALGNTGIGIEEAFRYASAAAAIACTRFGGRTGLPTDDEVNELMRAQP